MRKEMERQERERKKEEERMMREKMRMEEKYQREEKREIERREKFLQRELLKVGLCPMRVFINLFPQIKVQMCIFSFFFF